MSRSLQAPGPRTRGGSKRPAPGAVPLHAGADAASGADPGDDGFEARKAWLDHGLSARSWSERLRELHPARFFLQAWKVLDEESERARPPAAARAYDARPMIALCVGAVCLTLMEYFGHSTTFRELLDTLVVSERGQAGTTLVGASAADGVWSALRSSRWVGLADFAWWSAWRVLGYFVVPALVVRFWFKERLRDHGLETGGIAGHAWIYALSYGAVFIGVLFVARFVPHFTQYYPFYGHCSRSWTDFLAWEVLYAAQFFALEFFFRGFWMRSMRDALGSHAIIAMVVPYCMIHFGKPMIEALAAIFAGVVLGTLALRTRSIWSGCVVHIGVAVTMDVTALVVSGRGLPSVLFPS